MNKKLYLILILTLTLLPIAAATIGEGIDDALSLLFDSTGDLAFIKAGIWLVLFFVIFKSAERIFPTNRGAAAVISLVVSMLGARFMPDEYLEYIGGGYAFLIGFILLLLPFFIGSILGDMLRFGRSGKTFLILLLYAAFGYSLIQWQGFYLGTEALSALSPVLNWMGENTIIVLIIIAVICLFFLFRTRSGGGMAIPAARSSGGGGPRFWQGLGSGAGATLGWIARKRAAAKMRWAIQEAHRRKRQPLPPSRQIGWFRGGIR